MLLILARIKKRLRDTLWSGLRPRSYLLIQVHDNLHCQPSITYSCYLCHETLPLNLIKLFTPRSGLSPNFILKNAKKKTPWNSAIWTWSTCHEVLFEWSHQRICPKNHKPQLPYKTPLFTLGVKGSTPFGAFCRLCLQVICRWSHIMKPLRWLPNLKVGWNSQARKKLKRARISRKMWWGGGGGGYCIILTIRHRLSKRWIRYPPNKSLFSG